MLCSATAVLFLDASDRWSNVYMLSVATVLLDTDQT